MKRKKDSWTWTTVWWLQGDGVIRGLYGNGNNAIKTKLKKLKIFINIRQSYSISKIWKEKKNKNTLFWDGRIMDFFLYLWNSNQQILLENCSHRKEWLHLRIRIDNVIYVQSCFWPHSEMKTFHFYSLITMNNTLLLIDHHHNSLSNYQIELFLWKTL